MDFYCPELKLAIEVDGDSHFLQGAEGKDAKRQAEIESHGICFLRFTNGEVYSNMDGVLMMVEDFLKRKTSP